MHGWYMNIRGSVYWGVGLCEYGHKTVAISKNVAMAPKEQRMALIARHFDRFTRTV